MNPTKLCTVCRRPIAEAVSVCPYCHAQQPTITPTEIVSLATLGAVVYGALLGLIGGWLIGAVAIRWWGLLIGLFLGLPDLGERWALAVVPYTTWLGGLLAATAFGIGTFLNTRRYLRQQQAPPRDH